MIMNNETRQDINIVILNSLQRHEKYMNEVNQEINSHLLKKCHGFNSSVTYMIGF